MTTRVIEGECLQCGGVVDVWTTDHDIGGTVVKTTYDRMKCRSGCLGHVWDPPGARR